MKALGLVRTVRQDENIKEVVRQVAVMALVPDDRINQGYESILNFANDTGALRDQNI